jgi:hypothetical protein
VAFTPTTIQITEKVGAGAMPGAVGGTIVPGTYDLTDAVVFGVSPAPPPVPPETYVFDASGTYQGASLGYAAGTGTWSTHDTTLTFTPSCSCWKARGCGRGRTYSVWYSAGPAHVVTFETYGNGGTTMRTFTRRTRED